MPSTEEASPMVSGNREPRTQPRSEKSPEPTTLHTLSSSSKGAQEASTQQAGLGSDTRAGEGSGLQQTLIGANCICQAHDPKGCN